jgi:hypothetical protein
VPRRSLALVSGLSAIALAVAAAAGFGPRPLVLLTTGSFVLVYDVSTAAAVRLLPRGRLVAPLGRARPRRRRGAACVDGSVDRCRRHRSVGLPTVAAEVSSFSAQALREDALLRLRRQRSTKGAALRGSRHSDRLAREPLTLGEAPLRWAELRRRVFKLMRSCAPSARPRCGSSRSLPSAD